MSFLDDAVTAYYDGKRRVTAQASNRASSAGVECKRQLLWSRTRWQDAALPDISLQRNFSMGSALEPIVVRMLEDSGIQITQRQRDLTWKERFNLTGHVDGIVRCPDGSEAVLEIKMAARWSFERIRSYATASALMSDTRAYVRGYCSQVALYCLLLSINRGLIFFISKDTGQTHSIEVSLDDPFVLGAAEAALRRFEAVELAVKEGRDLPAEPGDHCKSCRFFGPCAPDLSFAGMGILTDPDTEAALDKRGQLKESVREFDLVDADLKERFTEPGTFAVGTWVVTVKKGQKGLRRSYDKLPAAGEGKDAQVSSDETAA